MQCNGLKVLASQTFDVFDIHVKIALYFSDFAILL